MKATHSLKPPKGIHPFYRESPGIKNELYFFNRLKRLTGLLLRTKINLGEAAPSWRFTLGVRYDLIFFLFPTLVKVEITEIRVFLFISATFRIRMKEC